VILIVLFRL